LYLHLPLRALQSSPPRRSSGLILMEARFVTNGDVWKGLAFTMLKGRVKYLSRNLKKPTAMLRSPGALTSFVASLSMAVSSEVLRSEEHTSALQSRFELVCSLRL